MTTLASGEKELIEAALAESERRVSGPRGAAAKLGIPRQTLEWNCLCGCDQGQWRRMPLSLGKLAAAQRPS